jgi:hypothetical protein
MASHTVCIPASRSPMHCAPTAASVGRACSRSPAAQQEFARHRGASVQRCAPTALQTPLYVVPAPATQLLACALERFQHPTVPDAPTEVRQVPVCMGSAGRSTLALFPHQLDLCWVGECCQDVSFKSACYRWCTELVKHHISEQICTTPSLLSCLALLQYCCEQCSVYLLPVFCCASRNNGCCHSSRPVV